MPDFPQSIEEFLESLTDAVIPTDGCLEDFDILSSLAELGQSIDINVLTTFVGQCVGG
jgi:hypothetical protein